MQGELRDQKETEASEKQRLEMEIFQNIVNEELENRG